MPLLRRARAIDAAGLEGANAVKLFRLRAHPLPPELSLPLDQQLAHGDRVFFRWEHAAEADGYLFELAKDAGFKQVQARIPQISDQTRGVLLALPAGQYFWRVASVTKEGTQGPFSDVFSLIQAEPRQGDN